MKRGYKELIVDAQAQITTWTVADAIDAVGRPDVVFVDIREPEELARDGKIPGADAAPRGMIEFYADPESPYHRPVFASGKTILLYCASGGRSALAAKTLKDMGLKDVAHVGGGFKSWVEGGGPVDGWIAYVRAAWGAARDGFGISPAGDSCGAALFAGAGQRVWDRA